MGDNIRNGDKSEYRATKEAAVKDKKSKNGKDKEAQALDASVLVLFAQLLELAEQKDKITVPWQYGKTVAYDVSDIIQIHNNRLGGGCYSELFGGKAVSSRSMAEKMFPMVAVARKRQVEKKIDYIDDEDAEMAWLNSWIETKKKFLAKYKEAAANKK